MRYYQHRGPSRRHLHVETGGDLHDLSAVKPSLHTLEDLLDAAAVTDQEVDDITAALLEDAPTVSASTLEDGPTPPPVSAEEVWAAGVTYRISEEAREAESSSPDMYLEVYDSDRPEIFFKATPSRTVGNRDEVGIRADSVWDVPEPELGVVLHHGQIVGYTVGNDMSSRSIEGENPLYLPQAKVYDRCCAIGPCVRSATAIDDPHDLEMWMTISRDGDVLYEDSTSTGKMVRTVDELVSYFCKHNTVPDLAVLLTGTSLVPDEGFTLEADDRIEIGIEEIGQLENTVREV